MPADLPMSDRYHFAYAEASPYGHAVRLLAEHSHVADGVVVDLGCGFGAIAEPLRDRRLGYVGLDLEPSGVADLCHRGFEGALVDLSQPDRLAGRIDELLAGRPLAALCALDVLEHLTNGPAVLAALRQVAIDHGRVALVVSIPNVAHLDLAAKLVVGRWDVTPTGLLDETHVALYAPARLDQAFAAAGWAEVGEADFELVESDQHFPADAAMLAPTPLHHLLAGIRRRAAPGATTNQFVRAYVPAAVPPPLPPPEQPPPFLSVLVVDGGDDDRLTDALVALDAQELPDGELDGGPASVEVVCCTLQPTRARREALERLVAPFAGRLAGRTRLVAVDPPAGSSPSAARALLLDAGLQAATGRYVTVLDDGHLPFAHWLDTFARLAATRPGAVVRSLALSQHRHRVAWPGGRNGDEPVAVAQLASAPRFDLVDHLAHGGTPPGSYAVPRTYFTDLGGRFALGTPGLEDDHLLARAAMICGLHDDPTTAVLLCRPPAELAAAPPPDRSALLAALDLEPLLLPAGSLLALAGGGEPAAGAGAGAGAEAAVGPEAEAEAEPATDGQAAVARAEAERDAAVAARQASDQTLVAVRAELAAARAELAAMQGSASWKVTAPLRRWNDRHPL